MAGFFGKAFDFDGNGKLDAFERASEYGFLNFMQQEEEHDELRRAGIDPERLEYMSSSRRRQILKEAGLDPSEYDF